MPQYEGRVIRIGDQGRAEVLLCPENAEIPDAPDVSKRVCHCSSAGSTIVVEAQNAVCAKVRDRVLVRSDPGPLLLNAAILLGCPLIAVLVSVGSAALLSHWS